MRLPSVEHRVNASLALLLTLFLTIVVVHIVVDDRIGTDHDRRMRALQQARDLNRAVLQDLTDAETGIRGFQATGDRTFLEPYDSGRAAAGRKLDRLDAGATAGLRALLADQRAAASQWLYGYAVPIVNAGLPDTGWQRAVRGSELFAGVRATNGDVDAAIEALQETQTAATRRESRLADVASAGLAGLILLVGLGLARLHQRHLTGPLGHIRRTLRRLSDGDLSARAVPAGPGELRAVAVRVNDLAEQTERLIAAEHARAAGAEMLRAVAERLNDSEVTDDSDPAGTGALIAELLGTTFGADAVHGLVNPALTVRWPADAPAVEEDVLVELRAGRPVPGVLAAPLNPDPDGPAGLICVIGSAEREWTADERRLLAALADEVDHAIRRRRLRLRQARLIGELRTLDEQKDVFVSTVTHELRTPLTSILGYAEMLAESDSLSPFERRSVDAILRNAHRLEDTVGDLLLLDRTADRAAAEQVPVDLGALATALHADLDTAVRAKDLRSELTAEPAWVRGDGTRLRLALRYLLENAIKFTPAGGRLECRLTADGGNVVVAVTDTGIGIPADDVPGLFTPFHRAANAMDQAVQGTGLGLAIVRTIVTEHGGTVAARSELGRGSTFTMTLPAIPTSPQPLAAASTPGRG